MEELTIGEEEMKKKMDIINNLKELLPQTEDIEPIRLEVVEYIASENTDILERNKEKLLSSYDDRDDNKGKAYQLGIERSIKKPDFLK